MTVFLSRSGWGALPPNRDSAPRATTTHVFIHHSATPKPATIDEAKAQWAHFQVDHLHRPISSTNPTLWADIAYNLGVSAGVILEGRGWDVKGGGTGPGQKVPHPSGSWDNVSVSICVIGNYQTETLDDATRASLVEALTEARSRYGDDLIIMGDRDVNFTSCCGDNLYALLPALWAESGAADMALTDDDVKRIADAVWLRVVKNVPNEQGVLADFPIENVVGFAYIQALRAHLAVADLAKVAITTGPVDPHGGV